MGFKKFDQGISGSRLQEWKEREARELLRREMTSRWQESKRILEILRTTGSVSEITHGVDGWYHGVRSYPATSHNLEQVRFWTPINWLGSRFPEVEERFGRAFFEEATVELNGTPLVRATVIILRRSLGERGVSDTGWSTCRRRRFYTMIRS